MDRRGLLTLLASHAETSRTNVLRGRVMNPAPKCSSSPLMKGGNRGRGKGISLMKCKCVCVCVWLSECVCDRV